ncbi:Putative Co/Zn/Cd efflux system membrane fusion protein [Marinobacter nitratireducens]|uniref:Co/Zn/Cd efflux system membrane fusion protein n=1 Tax=Marinobacter nitratireducens TaxID=1137280 RepID=A0A072MYS1_9GAMM|nr:efflux RND transporter periplasmic adaptor subunit [Marinobacter nitratireducens]KEF30416.1 Putative Co/Zn/Cd efflux system membrane fusion protein [Marinobacter nitratireducens]
MWKQWIIALVLVAASAAVALTYRSLDSSHSESAMGERPPSKVNTHAPQVDTVTDVVKAVGNLQAMDAVALTTEVSGRIVELNLAPGQHVSKGDLLVRLDDRQARADLNVIEAQLADARRQFERARSLRSNNSISQSQVDELRTAVDVAEAQRQAARVRLENHRLQAPFDGVVGLTDLSVGAYVAIGTIISTLDSVDPMELNFSIPERFLAEVSLGQPVSGRSPAFPETSFTGELVELGSRINELSRTLPVRALIDNPDGKLRPGQFMSASLTLRQRQALVIPEQAVMIRGDETYVFLAVDGTAQRRSVVLGSRMPGRVEIAEGLSAEDLVIVTGQDRLSSGDRIRVVDEDSAIPDNRFAGSMES